MIATWMLYCSLCALGLSIAGVLAERALLAGRGPVRLVWIGAVTLSLLVPVVAFRFAERPVIATTKDASISHDVVANQVVDNPVTVSAPIAGPVRLTEPSREWRAGLGRLDEPLMIVWITLSLALVFDFFAGIITLAWMRRRWQRRTVQGFSVFVSERTGPAVVGVVDPAIVLPEWVLGLEPKQLGLMLRHENEHRRAGDGRLLTAAQLALIAMPWNPALWWQVLRLRVAVELDCDARVLQDADPRSYGDLLLEMARPRQGPRLMGATSFAERATQLEKRIRVLGRHRSRTTRAARALATSIGLVAVTVAWVTPHPQAPARAQALQVVSQPTPPVQQAVPAAAAAVSSTDKPVTNLAMQKPIVKPVSDRAERERATTASETPPPAGRPASELIRSAFADSIFERLFEGITLQRDQEARARDLLARLAQLQLVQDAVANVSQAANRLRTVALTTRRDSALRALLTSDADRATFDQRMAQGGGRGWVDFEFSPGDSAGGGRGARGGGGGARQGRGGVVDTLRLRFDTLTLPLRRMVREQIDGVRLRADTTGTRGGGRGVARGGGGGARGGGDAGGGRGGRDGAPDLPAERALLERYNTMLVEAVYNRFFNGMSLTPEQEAAARDLITRTQVETTAQRPQIQPVALRLNRRTGMVSMQAESAAELLALVSNEADRATLQSRIVINQP
ncbi:MAG: M56 family metallopeptidase [Gemmatimonadota bacterium]